ncbi:hypothetical protein [Candidatus Nephthysia bennettiae]|uniref:Uncharacterized protein n=1 Tax=Candidatus Nephthysia bennettiae TaxID=3127016 RepID=A0A934K2E6_9BACT|nr:hypothetical protein [Candidatus Dormibacteraeota bacterium]MBJ7613281.1 hypothetical protein [Candidatus Dormibacteraeota bacterium]
MMQSPVFSPSLGSVAAAAIVLIAAAALALALLIARTPGASVTRPAAAPPAVTVVHAAPNANSNPDSALPICRRHGGPAC